MLGKFVLYSVLLLFMALLYIARGYETLRKRCKEA